MFDACFRPGRIAIAVVAAALAASGAPATAGDLSLAPSEAIDAAELAEHRAGSFTVSGNANQTLFAQTQQEVTGTQNGTIEAGSADGGALTIGGEAMSNARGMVNVTANTGPNALVQGVMSLTVVLTDPP